MSFEISNEPYQVLFFDMDYNFGISFIINVFLNPI
jgi:hypothetical protein